MRTKGNNYAFIDNQNVNLAIRGLGWRLDWVRFRVYLKEKYGVSNAFLFLGFMPKNQNMYDFLTACGYIIIFKPVVEVISGTKGNCDAELVLHTMIHFENFTKAIIVSGDGDFACLVEYLRDKNKLERLIVPNKKRYSKLLKMVLAGKHVSFMNDMEVALQYKPKMPPDKPDGTFVGGST
ncbi:MAG: NYN domain-containing protein [Parcubacteria group bacterium]|nr:NYN domain-containing protein [Parcubacteria group bacterium]